MQPALGRLEPRLAPSTEVPLQDRIKRPRPDRVLLEQATALLRAAKTPLIIAGGGVIYSEATDTLARFAGATGVAVVETMA